jgi:hypothetical protein
MLIESHSLACANMLRDPRKQNQGADGKRKSEDQRPAEFLVTQSSL